MEDLKRIERSVLTKARRAKSLQDVSDLRAEVLGKKGTLGLALRSLGELPPEERPKAGEKVNALKMKIETALEAARVRVETERRTTELETGAQDVTLPGRRVVAGLPHPLRIVERDIIRALEGLGFTVALGPQVEHDWYNFEALNFPPDHPARDTQDTFFIKDKVLLRTHTSNVQVRTMVKGKLPIRILAPGMVFRHDEIDATHTPCFHQIEGLWVDDRTTFADLKGVLHVFASRIFGPERRVRFRPSFFPFTEPSAEMDVSCALCGGKGGACRPCKGTGWIEIMGAGMVDPAVFESVGLDPEKVQGYAFGMGIERIALLRWGVDDIRLFYENDARFLEQFSARSST
jgi:phenylalanyl-tRNA synthetase alpha chain